MPRNKKGKGQGSGTPHAEDKAIAFVEEAEPTGKEIEESEVEIDETKKLVSSAVAEKTKSSESSVSHSRQSEPQLDATQIYLKEIGFSPLLTAAEEVYYGRLAKKAMKPLEKK